MPFLFKVNLNPGMQPVEPVLPSPTPTRTCTPTITPTITPTPTVTPTITRTPTITPTTTRTPTVTPTITRTPTKTPNYSPTPTPTITPTITPPVTRTQTPTVTRTPTVTPTVTMTPSPIFLRNIIGNYPNPVSMDGITVTTTTENATLYYNFDDTGGSESDMIIYVGGTGVGNIKMVVAFGSNRLGQLFGFSLTPGGSINYIGIFTQGAVYF